jgi:hypothetical protein
LPEAVENVAPDRTGGSVAAIKGKIMGFARVKKVVEDIMEDIM